MPRKAQSRYTLALLLIWALILSGCVGVPVPLAGEAPVAPEQAMPEDQPAPAEMAVVEEVAVEATVSEYLATIPDGFMAMGLDAFKAQREATDVYLVDVRTPGEYEAGHIEGAVSIPLRTLAQNLAGIPTDMPVVVYCASGHRAGMATSVLRSLGYDNVRAFPAGWRGWSAAGEPASMDAVEPGAFGAPDVAPALVEAADSFLSNIPEGFYAVGNVERLQTMMDATDIFLLDVRTQAEVDETGVIPGATHIDLRELGSNLDQIPQDMPVVAYCKSGFRAALATGALHMMGYSNVQSFPPSFNGWLEAGEATQAMGDVEAGAVEGDSVVAAVDEYLSTIPDGYMTLGLDAFKAQREATDVYLIDVRTPGEYEAGHIEGAVSIPLRTLAQNLTSIPTDMPVVVYCASGHRAAMATSSLRILGYENVRAFPAGWKGWSAAGEPASMDAVAAGEYAAPEIDPALVEAVDGFLSTIPEGFYAVGSVEQLATMMDATDIFLLDVRTQGEVDETGVIPGATHIDLRELGSNLDQIPTDVPVITYCKSGYRAALAAGALHAAGFQNVRSFPPSFNGWLEADMEVSTP